MKTLNQHIKSQLKEKKATKKDKKSRIALESIQPEPLSSFTEIPLKKEKKDILVAESEEMSMIVLKAILEKNDFTFELAATQSDAINAYERYHFHIVLIGINNSTSWNELIEKVWTENNKTPLSFLIAITLPPDQPAYSEYLNSNFDKIILKPFKETELTKALKKFKKLIPKRKTPNNHYTFKLDQLRRISNNNEEFVMTMLQKFIETAEECTHSINAAISPFDINEIRKAAHKGIPSYSILELKELTDLLIYFERNLLVDDDINSLKDKVALFTTKNKDVIAEIKKFLKHRR